MTKYSPSQPRDELGRWTDAGGSDGEAGAGSEDATDPGEIVGDALDGIIDEFVDGLYGDGDEYGADSEYDDDGEFIDAQSRRGPTQPITVGGRTLLVSPRMALELEAAAARARNALDSVRERDPQWSPTPSMYDPENPNGALSHYRGQAQEAEARLLVLDRGNLPLGFNSQQDFREFGRTADAGFRQAGYTDAASFIRGSAVTGRSYTEGRPFDGGVRPSDYDLAVVSPQLMARARELGIPLRGGGVRTDRLTNRQMEDLRISDMTNRLRLTSRRDVNWMIYDSVGSIVERGPFIELP